MGKKNNIYKNVAGRGLVTGLNYHRHPGQSVKQEDVNFLLAWKTILKSSKYYENLTKE